jgi:hypothetical protein
MGICYGLYAVRAMDDNMEDEHCITKQRLKSSGLTQNMNVSSDLRHQ